MLISVGLTPQVVTETLWWLSVRRIPAWTPDQLVIITTGEGADRVGKFLLGAGTSQIAALGRDHGRDELVALADRVRIEVISAGDDTAFQDIDSDEAHKVLRDNQDGSRATIWMGI